MPRMRGDSVGELFLHGGADGANICTVAAIDALIFIDNVDAVAFRDAILGTLVYANATADASIRNLISHNPNLLYSRRCVSIGIIDHLQKFRKG
jgi:hypothetical protein